MNLFFILIGISLTLMIILSLFYEHIFEFLPLFVLFPVLISFFVSAFVMIGKPTIDTIVSEESIYSLQDNISISSNGAFTIYHSTEENKYYYYVYDEKNNGLKYGSCSSKNIIIRFDDNPRLVKYRVQTKNKKLCRWFFDINSKDYKVLYIPKDSIVNSVNIDLK